MPYVSDIILFAHPTFGVLGVMSAMWVMVEALNTSATHSSWRLRVAAAFCTLCIVAAWVIGGYWYVTFYPAEKDIILKGPWPWAHDLFMETKEHLFFIPLILALYLPIATTARLTRDRGARIVVIVVAGLIVFNGLAIEGAGAVINHGVKLALLPLAATGVK